MLDWYALLTPADRVRAYQTRPHGCADGQALGYTSNCVNDSILGRRGCIPFPFASGFFVLVSRTLAAEVVSSRGMLTDLTLLKSLTHSGTSEERDHKVAYEDVWLGSVISRLSEPASFRASAA